MLNWEKLLNETRRKELHGSYESIGTGVGRMEIERDYDRILFAARVLPRIYGHIKKGR